MRRSPEADLQIAAVQYIRTAYPTLTMWFVPNGGNLSRAQAGKFKAMGLLAGVPDLHFILPQGRLGCIELKGPRGTLSEAQKDFREKAERSGVQWAQCRSLEEVELTLINWLQPWGWKPLARIAA